MTTNSIKWTPQNTNTYNNNKQVIPTNLQSKERKKYIFSDNATIEKNQELFYKGSL